MTGEGVVDRCGMVAAVPEPKNVDAGVLLQLEVGDRPSRARGCVRGPWTALNMMSHAKVPARLRVRCPARRHGRWRVLQAWDARRRGVSRDGVLAHSWSSRRWRGARPSSRLNGRTNTGGACPGCCERETDRVGPWRMDALGYRLAARTAHGSGGRGGANPMLIVDVCFRKWSRRPNLARLPLWCPSQSPHAGSQKANQVDPYSRDHCECFSPSTPSFPHHPWIGWAHRTLTPVGVSSGCR